MNVVTGFERLSFERTRVAVVAVILGIAALHGVTSLKTTVDSIWSSVGADFVESAGFPDEAKVIQAGADRSQSDSEENFLIMIGLAAAAGVTAYATRNHAEKLDFTPVSNI